MKHSSYQVSHFPDKHSTIGRNEDLDYDGSTPLFRRVFKEIPEDERCLICQNPDKEYYYSYYGTDSEMVRCSCGDEKTVCYTQVVISVSGDARQVKPGEAVFIIRIYEGVSTTVRLTDDLQNMQNPIVEFSLSDSLNDWEANPHLPLIKQYMLNCSFAQMFDSFRGAKGGDKYVLAFDLLISKILWIQVDVNAATKTNPHFGKKGKKKT
jgi:hypothetical protein